MRERKEGGNSVRLGWCHVTARSRIVTNSPHTRSQLPPWTYLVISTNFPSSSSSFSYYLQYSPSQRVANASLYPKGRSEATTHRSRHARQAANLSTLSTFQKGTPAPMIGDELLADQLHLPLKGAHRGGTRPSQPVRAKDHHVQARQAECVRGVRSRRELWMRQCEPPMRQDNVLAVGCSYGGPSH